MSEHSLISWTDSSWNPVTGCSKVSAGCEHCYAERFAERWRGIPGHPYEQGFDLRLWPDRLPLPLKWKKPHLVFVNSMSDLFHDDVPVEFIREVFSVMNRADRHVFQVLTKRPARLTEVAPMLQWSPNIWLGVTVESQRYVERVDLLRQVPAAVRFISAEPLLTPLVSLDLSGIGWLIAGGESGHGRRPLDAEWVRSLRDQCAEAHVRFFFKQWGHERGRREAPILDGRSWRELPLPTCTFQLDLADTA